MLNTEHYAISNKKLISRLLPFFTSGKNLFFTLLAGASPLESLHLKWREWALSKMIDAVATSQPVVLMWYLKKVFLPYMADKNEEFSTMAEESKYTPYIFENTGEFRYYEYDNNHNWFAFEDDDDVANSFQDNYSLMDSSWLYSVNFEEAVSAGSDKLTIYAPKQINSLSNEAYIRAIRQSVEKYIVYDNFEYNIVIKAK